MKEKLKLYLKNKLRKLVKAKKSQTFFGALRARRIFYCSKYFYTQKYSLQNLLKVLLDMGIAKGDNIMVHSSYDEFYNYEGEINDLIESLINLVGSEGTLLMPCYGETDKKNFFDVKNTPSRAGLITEYFRRKEGTVRSINANFSICAYGKLAYDLTWEHINSNYGFDEKSPYFKFSQLDNCKVILLGLGKKSIIFSVVHCGEYILKKELLYFEKLFTDKFSCELIDYDGKSHNIKVISWVNNVVFNKKFLKNMYSYMARNTWGYRRLSNLDIVVYSAKEALETAIILARKGKVWYKNPVPKKELFIPLRRENE